MNRRGEGERGSFTFSTAFVLSSPKRPVKNKEKDPKNQEIRFLQEKFPIQKQFFLFGRYKFLVNDQNF